MTTMDRHEVIFEEVEFYQLDDRTPLVARLYRPANISDAPCLVDIHGGAWVFGSYLHGTEIGQELAARGIVMMSIEFRLPPRARYPQAIADIAAGIRWMKIHAKDYGTRADLVGGIGFSSGGHQLMLCALRPGDPRYLQHDVEGAKGVDAGLALAVLCYPVIDPTARLAMAQRVGRTELIGGTRAYFENDTAMDEGESAVHRGRRLQPRRTAGFIAAGVR